MRRLALILSLLAVGAAVARPLNAQKVRPIPTGPDADSDGVADADDRCPNTPAGSRVGRDGCPVTLMLRPATPAAPTPGANPAMPAPVTPGVTPAAGHQAVPTAPVPVVPGAAPVVTPQAAMPAAPVAPANAFTAGLALPMYGGGSRDAALEYGRTVGQMLDSAIVTLVGTFRNTSGQPAAGAAGPEALSQRERDRWGRCRDLHWDLSTYRSGLSGATAAMAGTPELSQAVAALDSALNAVQATAECDNVASMIAAPGRWSPWQQQYESSARSFYADWYAQIRNVHEKDRVFVLALNRVLPAGRRVTPLPALPPRPPYAGGAVR